MKVLYDPQIFTWQRFGGISRYFVELIKNIDADVKYKLPICVSNNEYLQKDKIANNRIFFPNCKFRGKNRIIGMLNMISFRLFLKTTKEPFDVFHPTYYDPYFLSSIGSKPLVVTVHDMIHELYAEMFGVDDCTSRNKKILCKRADKIIAISHNTKLDLIKIFDIPEEKIEVVYLGQSFKLSLERTLDLPERYVLFTGNRAGYKNFERFAEAFSRLDENISLICTGTPFSSTEQAMLQKLNVSNRVRLLFASDSQLSELYARASLFVFPSEYEGFGIPVLEAFASHCPIALSNASSFPEVAGEGGAYFDPLDVNSIYETMKKVLEDEYLRQELIANGIKQLEKFSWQKMAHQICELYKSLV